MKMKMRTNWGISPCRGLLQVSCLVFSFLVAPCVFSQSTSESSLREHWFVGAGAGAGIYFGDYNRQMKFADRPALGAEAFVGKWWSPFIGTRVGYAFQKVKGVTRNGSYSAGEVYDASQKLFKQKYDVGHLYGDVLFDVTSLFCARENRFYSLSPYIGLGWMSTWDSPCTNEISANIGLLNTFRLGNNLDLMLDLRGSAVDDRFDGETGGRKKEGILSANLGIIYHFGQRAWQTSGSGISDSERMLLNERITEMARENESLRNSLSSAPVQTVIEKEPVIQKVIEKVTVVEKTGADVLILFPIGKSVLTKESRVQLGFLSDVMKRYPEGTYTITGYADASTGTPESNERLSRARAESIKDTLVNEFGISAARLQTIVAGGVANQYYNDPSLSRSVIIRLN